MYHMPFSPSVLNKLLLALFRIIEPVAGSIYIDSVDITKVGLHDRKLFIKFVV